MRRAIILSGLCLAIFAAPAAAGSGNGLYKPYPAVIGVGGAESYYARLGRPLTAAQLGHGRFRSGLRAAAPGGPNARAGATAVTLGTGELAAIAAVALIGAGLALVRGRMAARPAGS